MAYASSKWLESRIRMAQCPKVGLSMMADKSIKPSNALEFAVFCVENVAAKLGACLSSMYRKAPYFEPL